MSDARSNSPISSIGISKKRPFKVAVCAVTLVAFVFNIVSYDLAWATPSVIASPSAKAQGEAVSKELNVSTFTLPQNLGTIKDSWQPASSTLRRGQRSSNGRAQGEYESLPSVVIHIQDAHCNYYAQHKIAEIIEYLNKVYGVNTINLEGGAKDYDLSIFTDIKNKAIREKVSDYFVKEGVVNGAEYYAINNPDKVNLWGMEDTGLYIENLKIYRNSLKHKEETDKYLKSLSHILANLKIHIYPKELLEFDARYIQYKAGNLEFRDYLNYLAKKAKERLIDIKASTNIFLLCGALGQEGQIDFRKANNERDELIDRLQRKLSRRSLEELVVKTVEYKSEKISQLDFYGYLVNKAKGVGIDMADFPELRKFIVYASTYAAIDKSRIMEEVDTLEKKIKETLFASDKEKELDILSKDLALMKNIFNISLTRDDYRYYQANERSFEMRNFVRFIGRESPLYKITAKLDENIDALDDRREEMARFYDYSFRRDIAFMSNMRLAQSSKLKAQREKSNLSAFSFQLSANRPVILITGGFHTENLADMFKKQGISYISIMPNFKMSDGYDCPYFKLLSGEKNLWIKDALPGVLNKALALMDQLSPKMMSDARAAGVDVNAATPAVAPTEALRSATSVEPLKREVAAPPAIGLTSEAAGRNGMLSALIGRIKRITGNKFSVGQEAIIRQEAVEVVRILLPDKSEAEKSDIAQRLISNALPRSIGRNIRICAFKTIFALFPLALIPAIIMVIFNAPAADYYTAMATFAEIYASVTFLFSALSIADANTVDYSNSRIVNLLRAIIGLHSGKAYLPPFANDKLFRQNAAHEFVHFLKMVEPALIKSDIQPPVASLMGELRTFEEGYEITGLFNTFKKAFDKGAEIMNNQDMPPLEKYNEAKRWAKRTFWYLGTDDRIQEPGYTYVFGRVLLGMGYALSVDTEIPGDLRRYAQLLASGIEPYDAESIIRSGKAPSAAGAQTPLVPTGYETNVRTPDDLNEWILQERDPNIRRVKGELKAALKYVTQRQFEEALAETMDLLNNELEGLQNYGIVFDAFAHKSKRWVYELARQRGYLKKEASAAAYANNGFNEVMSTDKVGSKPTFVIVDDLIVTGEQVGQIYKFITKYYPVWADIIIAVPYISEDAKLLLETNLGVRVITSPNGIIKPVRKDLRDGQGNFLASKGDLLIYFEYGIPDSFSFPPFLKKLLTKGGDEEAYLFNKKPYSIPGEYYDWEQKIYDDQIALSSVTPARRTLTTTQGPIQEGGAKPEGQNAGQALKYFAVSALIAGSATFLALSLFGYIPAIPLLVTMLTPLFTFFTGGTVAGGTATMIGALPIIGKRVGANPEAAPSAVAPSAATAAAPQTPPVSSAAQITTTQGLRDLIDEAKEYCDELRDTSVVNQDMISRLRSYGSRLRDKAVNLNRSKEAEMRALLDILDMLRFLSQVEAKSGAIGTALRPNYGINFLMSIANDRNSGVFTKIEVIKQLNILARRGPNANVEMAIKQLREWAGRTIQDAKSSTRDKVALLNLLAQTSATANILDEIDFITLVETKYGNDIAFCSAVVRALMYRALSIGEMKIWHRALFQLSALCDSKDIDREIRGLAIDAIYDVFKEAQKTGKADVSKVALSYLVGISSRNCPSNINVREFGIVPLGGLKKIVIPEDPIPYLQNVRESESLICYLFIKRFSDNEDFLKKIIADPSIDIRFRLYAFGLQALHHNHLDEPLAEFKKEVDRFIKQVADMKNIQAFLDKPSVQADIKVYTLALLVQGQYNWEEKMYRNDALFLNSIANFEKTNIVRGYDRAHQTGGEVCVGTQWALKASGRELFLVLAHEWFHDVMISDYEVKYSALPNESLHEFMADLFALTIARKNGWSAHKYRQITKTDLEYNAVSKRDWRSVNGHEAARAQLVAIENKFDSKDNNLWQHFFESAVETLKTIDTEKVDFYEFVRAASMLYAQRYLLSGNRVNPQVGSQKPATSLVIIDKNIPIVPENTIGDIFAGNEHLTNVSSALAKPAAPPAITPSTAVSGELCVTADTLLTLKDGRQVPIVEIKQGNYVMSLNESTRLVEPHRVVGLLDMGVKPVYKLTTASGRSIKTTANHPYLTRGGWVKVKGLRAGEEIAVPPVSREPLRNPQSDKGEVAEAFMRGNALQRFNLPGLQPQRNELLFGPDELYFGRLQLIGKLCYVMGVPKLALFFERPEFRDFISHRFLPPFKHSAFRFGHRAGGNYFSPCLPRIFKYYRKITSGGCLSEGNIPFKSRFKDMGFSIKAGFFDFIRLDAVPCDMAYGARVPGDLFNSQDSASTSASSISGNTKDVKSFLTGIAWAEEISAGPETRRDLAAFGGGPAGDILWDKIVSIEPLGREHVYDIEVEGTHNFIGNSIFAHNTAIHPIAQTSAAAPTAPPAAATPSLGRLGTALSRAEGPEVPLGTGKGVIGFFADAIFALMILFGIKITPGRKNFIEDFIIPAVEEGLMILGLYYGSPMLYLGIRIGFVVYHAFQNRAPPDIKPTLLDKTLIPILASLGALAPFVFFAAAPSLGTVFIAGYIAHSFFNIGVTISAPTTRLQKAVLGGIISGITIPTEPPPRWVEPPTGLIAGSDKDIERIRWIVSQREDVRNYLGDRAVSRFMKALRDRRLREALGTDETGDYRHSGGARQAMLLKTLELCRTSGANETPQSIVTSVVEDFLPSLGEERYGAFGSIGSEVEVMRKFGAGYSLASDGRELPHKGIVKEIYGTMLGMGFGADEIIEFAFSPSYSWRSQAEIINSMRRLGFISPESQAEAQSARGSELWNSMHISAVYAEGMEKLKGIRKLSKFIEFTKMLLYTSKARIQYFRESRWRPIDRKSGTFNVTKPTGKGGKFAIEAEEGERVRIEYRSGEVTGAPWDDGEAVNETQYGKSLRIVQTTHGLMMQAIITALLLTRHKDNAIIRNVEYKFIGILNDFVVKMLRYMDKDSGKYNQVVNDLLAKDWFDQADSAFALIDKLRDDGAFTKEMEEAANRMFDDVERLLDDVNEDISVTSLMNAAAQLNDIVDRAQMSDESKKSVKKNLISILTMVAGMSFGNEPDCAELEKLVDAVEESLKAAGGGVYNAVHSRLKIWRAFILMNGRADPGKVRQMEVIKMLMEGVRAGAAKEVLQDIMRLYGPEHIGQIQMPGEAARIDVAIPRDWRFSVDNIRNDLRREFSVDISGLRNASLSNRNLSDLHLRRLYEEIYPTIPVNRTYPEISIPDQRIFINSNIISGAHRLFISPIIFNIGRMFILLKSFFPKRTPYGLTGYITMGLIAAGVLVLNIAGVMSDLSNFCAGFTGVMAGRGLIYAATRYTRYLASIRGGAQIARGPNVARLWRRVNAEFPAANRPQVIIVRNITDMDNAAFQAQLAGLGLDAHAEAAARAEFNSGYWYNRDSGILYINNNSDINARDIYVNNALYERNGDVLFIHKNASRGTDFGFGVVLAHEKGKRFFLRSRLSGLFGGTSRIRIRLRQLLSETVGNLSEAGFILTYWARPYLNRHLRGRGLIEWSVSTILSAILYSIPVMLGHPLIAPLSGTHHIGYMIYRSLYNTASSISYFLSGVFLTIRDLIRISYSAASYAYIVTTFFVVFAVQPVVDIVEGIGNRLVSIINNLQFRFVRAINTRPPLLMFLENIVVPGIEEGVMIALLFSDTLYYYAGVRLIFTLLHALQDRSPQYGKPRNFAQKVTAPALITLASLAIAPFYMYFRVSLWGIFAQFLFHHMLVNTMIDLWPESGLQKGVLGLWRSNAPAKPAAGAMVELSGRGWFVPAASLTDENAAAILHNMSVEQFYASLPPARKAHVNAWDGEWNEDLTASDTKVAQIYTKLRPLLEKEKLIEDELIKEEAKLQACLRRLEIIANLREFMGKLSEKEKLMKDELIREREARLEIIANLREFMGNVSEKQKPMKDNLIKEGAELWAGLRFSGRFELETDGERVIDKYGTKVVLIDYPVTLAANGITHDAIPGVKRGVVYITKQRYKDWEKEGEDYLRRKIEQEHKVINYLRDKVKKYLHIQDANMAYGAIDWYLSNKTDIWCDYEYERIKHLLNFIEKYPKKLKEQTGLSPKEVRDLFESLKISPEGLLAETKIYKEVRDLFESLEISPEELLKEARSAVQAGREATREAEPAIIPAYIDEGIPVRTASIRIGDSVYSAHGSLVNTGVMDDTEKMGALSETRGVGPRRAPRRAREPQSAAAAEPSLGKLRTALSKAAEGGRVKGPAQGSNVDRVYEGGRMFEETTSRLWDIVRVNGNRLGPARYDHLIDILRQYSDTMPVVYLVSRKDMDRAGIGKKHNVVRFGNNIMIEDDYYEKNLTKSSADGKPMDSLLNVLVHEMTAARLEGKAVAGDVPVRAEGRLDREDWEKRRAKHEELVIDRAMEGKEEASQGAKAMAVPLLREGDLVVSKSGTVREIISIEGRFVKVRTTKNGNAPIEETIPLETVLNAIRKGVAEIRPNIDHLAKELVEKTGGDVEMVMMPQDADPTATVYIPGAIANFMRENNIPMTSAVSREIIARAGELRQEQVKAAAKAVEAASEAVIRHNEEILNSGNFWDTLLAESIGGNAGVGRAGVNIVIDEEGRIVAIGNIDTLELKYQKRGYCHLCFSVLMANTPNPGIVDLKETIWRGNTSGNAKNNLEKAVAKYNERLVKKQMEDNKQRAALQRPQRQAAKGLLDNKHVILIGDIHGNLEGLRDILAAAGYIRKGPRWQDDEWIAGDKILLNSGDIMDRGTQAKEAREYLTMLRRQAQEDGGDVIRLIGNHDMAHIIGQLIRPMDVDDMGFWREAGKKDFEDGIVKAAVVINGRIWVHGKLVKDIENILRNEIADTLGIESDKITKQMIADRINAIVGDAFNNHNFEHPIFQEDGIFWARFRDESSQYSQLLTQGVGHDALKSVKMEGGHKLLGFDVGIVRGNLAWGEVTPNDRVYKCKIESGGIRREELNAQDLPSAVETATAAKPAQKVPIAGAAHEGEKVLEKMREKAQEMQAKAERRAGSLRLENKDTDRLIRALKHRTEKEFREDIDRVLDLLIQAGLPAGQIDKMRNRILLMNLGEKRLAEMTKDGQIVSGGDMAGGFIVQPRLGDPFWIIFPISRFLMLKGVKNIGDLDKDGTVALGALLHELFEVELREKGLGEDEAHWYAARAQKAFIEKDVKGEITQPLKLSGLLRPASVIAGAAAGTQATASGLKLIPDTEFGDSAILPASYTGISQEAGIEVLIAEAKKYHAISGREGTLVAGDLAIQALNRMVDNKNDIALPIDVSELAPIIDDFEKVAFDESGAVEALKEFLLLNPSIAKENIAGLENVIDDVNNMNERTEISMRSISHQEYHNLGGAKYGTMLADSINLVQLHRRQQGMDTSVIKSIMENVRYFFKQNDLMQDLIRNRIADRKTDRYQKSLPTMSVSETAEWRRYLYDYAAYMDNVELRDTLKDEEGAIEAIDNIRDMISGFFIPFITGRPNVSTFDLREAVRTMKGVAENLRAVQSVKFEFVADEGDLTVTADFKEMVDLLDILAQNSYLVAVERLEDENKVRASRGEAPLTLKDRPISLKISVQKEKDGSILMRLIEVSDNVGGITDLSLLEETKPGSKRQKATRLNESRRRNDTGFGLADIWHIVNIHKGTFWIRNIDDKPGKGIIASIRIPFIAAPPAATAAGEPVAVPADKPESRKAATVAAFTKVEGDCRDGLVKFVVGVPVGPEFKNGCVSTATHIGRLLGHNGYGVLSADRAKGSMEPDNGQVFLFYMDPNNMSATLESYKKAVEAAKGRLALDMASGAKGGHIAAFAPQIWEEAPFLDIYKEEANIITVPDAYTDCNPKEIQITDILARVVLGRLIVGGAMADDAEGKSRAFRAIMDYLEAVSDNDLSKIKDLDQFLDELKRGLLVMRIRPVDYDRIMRNWEESQKATATAA